jgi:hypothetical protein
LCSSQALLNFDAAMEDVRALDNISFSEWFEGKGGSRGSIKRMWDPIAYALVRTFYLSMIHKKGHGSVYVHGKSVRKTKDDRESRTDTFP